METIGTKIRMLRENREISQGQLALKLKVSKSLVSLWEIDERVPRHTELVKLADYFDVTSDFLLGIDDTDTKDLPIYRVMSHTVPVYGRIPAGLPFEAIENRLDDIAIPDWLASMPDLFGLLITGDSMNKVIPDGVIGVFQKCDSVDNGTIVAVIVNGFDATVKRYYRLTDSVLLEPQSYSPEYEKIIIEDGTETVHLLGRLVWFSPAGLVK